MRRVAHGVVWFRPEDQARVLALMTLQCSAVRSAYQASHKHSLSGNAVKKYVKRNYMAGGLNQRYVADACSLGAGIKAENALFGGRRAWEKLQTGTLSRSEWQQIRNSQLYSRGDRTKGGNPNIRVSGSTLLVNDPAARGQWIEGKLFLPDKWSPDLACYDARLLYRDGKFLVQVGWEETGVPASGTSAGAVGVDTNPDGLGIAEASGDGNLIRHEYMREQRIQFAEEGKRDYDVRALAKRVVEVAERTRKPLVIERLGFKQANGSSGFKKFRRTKANFLHRKILEAIRSRATRRGVPVLDVQPAFTSILGDLKYARMYSLNPHTAAALVIARRGLGLLERQDFTVTPKDEGGERLTLEGRGRSHTLSRKACSWLLDGFVRQPKPAGLTAPDPAPCWKHGIGSSTGETPVGEPSTTTGRRGQHQRVVGG